MATRQLPLVSLVVATRNEAKHLPALLESLAASEYPVERIEVLIVDGESTDGTREVAQGYVSR
ncbi:MAG TPA: glycosyltransferase, partial [Ktedonobacterales bacterium]|nr:glycosyltransferase [Ktedonobacterales bacterium]